jgi:PST family polysaccharide transporter
MSADRHLTRHVAVFSTAHAIGIIAPLLTTPYLARVLGPEGWAPVLLAQGIASLVALLPEFGFDLTGTRDLAVSRDRETSSRIVGDIYAARLLLIPVAAIVILALTQMVPLIGSRPSLALWTFVVAIARGCSPIWIFQGLGVPEGAVLTDAAGKLGAALAVFAFVVSPEDGWRVLALQSIGAGIPLLVLGWRVRRLITPAPLTLAGARRALARSWPVFSFRGASATYMQANILIIAALASPTAVTMFGGAERVIRAGINLLAPITQAIFPRVARAVPAGAEANRRALTQATRMIGRVGLILSLIALLAADPLITQLLGPGYEAAIPMLRGLAALPTLIAIGTVLGIHWAIPQGHERYFLRSVLIAGAISLTCAVLLIPRMGAWGMVIGATAAEAWVAGALLHRFLRHGSER